MTTPSIGGIIPALVTPLHEDQSLDTAALEKLLEHLYSTGCHGVDLCGSTGEGMLLPSAIRREIVEIAVSHTPPGRHVLVHVSAWSVEVAMDLARHAVTYVDNKTTHLWVGTELDPAIYIPGTCNGQPCSTTANTNQRRVLYLANPAYGAGISTLAQTDDGANTSFNTMMLTTQHRFTRNYTVLANYTYSHCLSSGNFSSDVTGPNYQNPANRNADLGNCSFDLRHNLSASIVAATPHFAGTSANRILANWQIAPLLIVHGGITFNPVTGVDNSRTGVGLDKPNVAGHPYLRNTSTRQWLNPTAFVPNPIGTFGNTGAYSLYGPPYFDIDVAVTRFLNIREGHPLAVRAAFFNLTNHVNFSDPTTSLQSRSFGVILAASDPRILQFSMKYTF
jgi:hypothetical protein